VRRTNFTTSPFYSDHISDIELTWIKLNITVMAPTNVAAAQWRDIWERDRGGDNVMTALLILSAAAAAATTTKSTMMRLPRGPSASHMVVCDMAYEQRASTNCGVRWTLMSHFSKLGVGQNYAFLYFFYSTVQHTTIWKILCLLAPNSILDGVQTELVGAHGAPTLRGSDIEGKAKNK